MNQDHQELRGHVLTLMNDKEKIEKEIKELTEILTLNGVGMNDSLVDQEGFPINAIDVYQVRHARHRIICLQNDHKIIMKQIEDGLEGYYSNSTARPSTNGNLDVEMRNGHSEEHLRPFLKVTSVEPGSPADISGLRVNDAIIEFGSVNFKNFKTINSIATVVRHSENSEILVKIQRNNNQFNTILVPKKWRGQGLLGCQLLPL